MSFEVNTDELMGVLANLSECIDTLRESAWRLNQSRVDLMAAMDDQPQIKVSLTTVEDNTLALISRVTQYRDSLGQIARLYATTEDKVYDEAQRVRLDAGARGAVFTSDAEPRVGWRAPQTGARVATQGPQLFGGAREGPLKLAGELFAATTRPL